MKSEYQEDLDNRLMTEQMNDVMAEIEKEEMEFDLNKELEKLLGGELDIENRIAVEKGLCDESYYLELYELEMSARIRRVLDLYKGATPKRLGFKAVKRLVAIFTNEVNLIEGNITPDQFVEAQQQLGVNPE